MGFRLHQQASFNPSSLPGSLYGVPLRYILWRACKLLWPVYLPRPGAFEKKTLLLLRVLVAILVRGQEPVAFKKSEKVLELPHQARRSVEHKILTYQNRTNPSKEKKKRASYEQINAYQPCLLYVQSTMLILALLRLIIRSPWSVEVILRQGLHYLQNKNIQSFLDSRKRRHRLPGTAVVDGYTRIPPAHQSCPLIILATVDEFLNLPQPSLMHTPPSPSTYKVCPSSACKLRQSWSPPGFSLLAKLYYQHSIPKRHP